MESQFTLFNCYPILGINLNCSPSEIKVAYRNKSKIYHPDLGGSNELMIKINLAYEILSNPIERQLHDLYWNINTGNQNRRDTSSEFNSQKQHQNIAFGSIRKSINDAIERQITLIFLKKDDLIKQEIVINLDEIKIQKIIAIFAIIAFIIAEVYLYIKKSYIWAVLVVIVIILTVIPTIYLFDEKILEKCEKDATDKVNAKLKQEKDELNIYLTIINDIEKLLIEESSFYDSESLFIRRLSASFFLMGYLPLSIDVKDRLLLVTDGNDRILIRFRHRDGIPANISYVNKLITLMDSYNATKSFLFCSPGLSANAQYRAKESNIASYSLEEMNSFVKKSIYSDYKGKDILKDLSQFEIFMKSNNYYIRRLL